MDHERPFNRTQGVRASSTDSAGRGPVWSDLFVTRESREHPDPADEAGVKEDDTIAGADDASDEAVHYVGVYIISVAARLAEMHPQTLRKYERFGLLRPSRTAGSLRLYSEEDLIRLRLIRNLVDRFDLNLAGVRLVMDLVFRLSHVLAQIEDNEALLQTRAGRVAVKELREVLNELAG